MSIRSSIRVITGLTAIRSIHCDGGANHSGFHAPRKRAAARRTFSHRFKEPG
jgi:hypothetical protein